MKGYINKTELTDKLIPAVDDEEIPNGKQIMEWVYQLGLILDKEIPTYGYDNFQRIEIAIRTFIKERADYG